MVALAESAQSKVQIALHWRRRNYSIIPVRASQTKDKRTPLIKWGAYRETRPTEDEIRAWWNQWPDANPAIVCGKLSGMFALDIDGPEALAWLIEQGLSPASATYTVWRGKRGRYHLWFAYPDFDLGCPILHPGVEVKGDGGLIPAPGATHWSGAPYEVYRELPIAAAPAWLIDKLRPAERKPVSPAQLPASDDQRRAYALAALEGEASTLAATQVHRNDQLFRSVASCARFITPGYLTETEVESVLCPIAHNIGLQSREIRSTFKSGVDHGIQAPDSLAHLERPSTSQLTLLSRNELSTPAPADWPAELPVEVERCVFQFWGKAGKTVNTLLRAALAYFGTSPFTLPDLANKSGVDYKKLWRAMCTYAGNVLFETKFQNDQGSTDQEKKTAADTDDHSGISQSYGQKMATVFQLPSYPEFVERLCAEVVSPHLADKHSLPLASVHRLARLGVENDSSVVEDINSRLVGACSEVERRRLQKALDRAQSELEAWRAQLSSPSVVPFPDEAPDWRQDYTGAVVARNILPVLSTPLRWAAAERAMGLPRSTIRRTEQRLHITRDEHFSEQRLIVNDVSELPDLEYSPDYAGFPARAIADTGETFDYRSPYARQALVQHMKHREVGSVAIVYQQASIPRRMTEAEIQARTAAPEKNNKIGSSRKKTLALPSPKPHIGPGSDPSIAVRWLRESEVLLKLPDLPGMSWRERVYRLAGRIGYSVEDCDVELLTSRSAPQQSPPLPLREHEYYDEYGFKHSRNTAERTKGAIWCRPREKATEALVLQREQDQ
jgi:hypothetical protein